MAKRMTKAETQGIAALIVIGLPVYGVMKLEESVGWGFIVAIVAFVIGLIIFFQAFQKKQRRDSLMAKYQDENLVKALMSRSFWQGQTAEQLVDSLGRPHSVDQKALKTKKKEVWKYNHQGGNRYGLRITLDNDQVVGWDQKT